LRGLSNIFSSVKAAISRRLVRFRASAGQAVVAERSRAWPAVVSPRPLVSHSGESVGAGDFLEEVVGAGFADVVRQHDGDAVVASDPFDPADGAVVGVVGGQARR
jgi:hypothetical protein